MKKLLLASLALSLTLTACNKQEASAPSKPEVATQPAEHTHDHDKHKDGEQQNGEQGEHKDGEHKEGEHAHDHAHGEHEGHAHQHHAGDTYKCDNDKTVAIAIHDHEGEIEAHATIDDVEYDLHPEDGKKDTYISKEEGINDKGMRMALADGKATFNDLDDKALLSCQKASS